MSLIPKINEIPIQWMTWRNKLSPLGFTEADRAGDVSRLIQEVIQGVDVIMKRNRVLSDRNKAEKLTGDKAYATISWEDIKALMDLFQKRNFLDYYLCHSIQLI